MDDSLLPIEICEQVIDACHWTEWLRSSSYVVWRRTAVVCTAWLARSRVNLFHHVVLEREWHVDLLLRTVLQTPHLADLVVMLSVSPVSGAYIPFARMPLPRLLTRCAVLHLENVDWWQYPPLYVDTGLRPHWSGITKLRIRMRHRVFSAILRFLWSLPALQDLYLWCDSIAGMRALGSLRARKPNACHNLKSLALEVCRDIYDKAVETSS